MRRRRLLGCRDDAVAELAFAPMFAKAKGFTDSGGRRVDSKDEVRWVFLAGPSASVPLYTVASEKMLG